MVMDNPVSGIGNFINIGITEKRIRVKKKHKKKKEKKKRKKDLQEKRKESLCKSRFCTRTISAASTKYRKIKIRC